MKHHYFTIGKKYDFDVTKGNVYVITNDRNKDIGFSDWQFKANFKSLDEIRQEKLEQLGI